MSARRRGQGSVYRKPGTSRWTIAYYVNGKLVRESSGTSNRNIAVKLLNEKLVAAGQGRPVGPEVDRTILADLVKMILDDYAANGLKSAKRVEYACGHLWAFFGADRKAKTLTNDAIAAGSAALQNLL
jgi:hypothetical protein